MMHSLKFRKWLGRELGGVQSEIDRTNEIWKRRKIDHERFSKSFSNLKSNSLNSTLFLKVWHSKSYPKTTLYPFIINNLENAFFMIISRLLETREGI